MRQHALVTNWNAILIFRVDFDSDACLFSDGQRKLRLLHTTDIETCTTVPPPLRPNRLT
ncbi:hypothetical protein AXR32_004338 [Salmonella enterica subsp. enterica]|nr:hypothetical protein [Salmonella enterica subsp. enterica serovar Mikawasima]